MKNYSCLLVCLLLFSTKSLAYIFKYTDSAGRVYYTDYSDDSELPKTIDECKYLRNQLIQRSVELVSDQVKIKNNFDNNSGDQEFSREGFVDPTVSHLKYKKVLIEKEKSLLGFYRLINEAIYNKELSKKADKIQINLMRSNK